MAAVLAAAYPWVVFAHIASVFGFLLAHGASVGVLFKLRGERKVEHVRALLDLSKRSIVWTYTFLVLIGVTGAAAAYIGDLWRQAWIWASAALLVLISLAMDWIGDPYFERLRVAVGLEEPQGKKDTTAPRGPLPDTPAGEEVLLRLLRSPRPWLLALVGIAGLVAILWLMVLKPDLAMIGCSYLGTPPEWACPRGKMLLANSRSVDSSGRACPGQVGWRGARYRPAALTPGGSHVAPPSP